MRRALRKSKGTGEKDLSMTRCVRSLCVLAAFAFGLTAALGQNENFHVLAFYSTHDIESLKDFRCGNESRDAFFLVWQDRFGRLPADQRACLQPVAQSLPVDSHGARILMIEKK